jgi:autotransporter-associated beta strand protein
MMYVSVKSSNVARASNAVGRTRRSRAIAHVALTVAAVAVLGRHVSADTWDPVPGIPGPGDGSVSGGTGVWDLLTANWTTDAGLTNGVWANGAGAAFGGSTAGTVTLVNGGVTVGGLAFDPTTTPGVYTLASQTPSDVLTLASPFVTVNQDAVINATIGGSVGLSKLGAGTLTLGGANTFSGTLTLAGGRLRVGSSANLGAASALAFNGGALEATGPVAFTNPVTVDGGGGTILLSNPASAVTLAGQLSGAGPLVVDGTGGGSLAVTNPANFNGASNTFTGNVSLNGGGSVTLGYAIAAPSGQVFAAGAGALVLGNSIPGATVSLSAGSTAQASGGGVVRLYGRAASSGTGVTVAGDLTALTGGRIEVGDGLADASHVRLLNTARLTVDGGTIVLRPRGAALTIDASSVNSLAVRNGGVLALGAGATGDLVVGSDVNQSGAWTLANQSGQTLRILGGVQDTTAGLTLRAEGGVTRYEADSIVLGSTAVNGTLGVDLRGGLIDINNAAPGKSFGYAPGYTVAGWGQLGTSAANQTHVVPAGGGASFYASGPAAQGSTLSIVGGFNEIAGARASFRIGDDNGLSLAVPNATATSAYVVNSVAIDPQSAGGVARFVVGGGVVQANAAAFTNGANRVRFDVQNGGTLISNVAGTGSLLVNGPGSSPINLAGGATFSTTSPTFLLNPNETIGGAGTLFGISGLSGTSPTNLTLNGTVDLNGTLAAAVNAASTGVVKLDAGESLVLTAQADLFSTSLLFGGTSPGVARLEVAVPTSSTVRLGTGGVIANAGSFAGTREFRVTSGTFQVDAADAATVTIDGVNQLSVDRTHNATADRTLLGTLSLNGGTFLPGATTATTTVSPGATLSGLGAYGHTNLADVLVNQGTVRAQGGQLNVTATGGVRGSGAWDPNGQVIVLAGPVQDIAGSPTQFRVTSAAGGRVQIAQAGSYTGGTLIDGSAGATPVTLRVGAAGALGSGGITINGGVLQIVSDAGLNFSTLPITVTGSGASQISYDRAGTSTASVTHRLGDLTIGGQTLSLTGPPTSSYVHSLTINSATVTPAGATLVQQGPNSVTLNALTLNGNLNLTLATPSFTVGPLSGAGSIVRLIPSGTLNLNKPSVNFTGNLTTAVGTTNLSASNVLAGGTFLFTNNGALTGTVNVTAAGALNQASGTQSAGVFNLNAGGSLDGSTLSLVGGNTNANAANALGSGTVLLGGGNLFLKRDAGTAFGGTITAAGPGAANLTVDRANGGSGTGGQHTVGAINVADRQLNLFQNNGYTLGVTGATTIGGTGASVIDNDVSLLSLASLQVNAQLVLTGTGSATIGNLGGTGPLKLQSGAAVTVTDAALPGFASSVQLSTGTLNLNHPAALTGGSATVAGGVLNLNAATTAPLALTSGFINANVADALAGNALPITNGTLFANAANALGSSTINLTGGNVTASAAGALGASQINLTNTTLALRSDTAAAFGGSVTVGGTNFSTISVAKATAAGSSGNRLSINTLVLGGQTLNVTGADNDVFTVLNPVTLVGAASTTINTTAADAFFQGSLTGAGPLVKSGVRTLTIDGGGNFGAASVNNGTLAVNNAWTTSGVTVGTATTPATLELGGATGVNTIDALAINNGTLRIAKPSGQDALPAALVVSGGTNGDVLLEYTGYANGRLANAINIDTSLAARKLTLAARSGTGVGQVGTFTYTGAIGRTGANNLTVVAQADGTQIDASNNLLREPSRMVMGGTQTFTTDLVHGGGVVIGKGAVPATGAGPFGASANALQLTVMDSSVGGMVADGQGNTTFSKVVTGAAPRARLGAYYNTATGGVQTVNFNGGFAWNDATAPLFAVNTPGTPTAAASVSFWNGLFADPGTILQVNTGAVLDNVLSASGTTVTATAPVYAGGGGAVRFNSNFGDGSYRNLAAAVGLAGTLTVLDNTTVQSNTSGHHFDGVDLRTGTYQVGNVNQLLTGGFAVNASPFEATRTNGNLITDFNLTLNGVGAGRGFAIAGGQTLTKSGAAALTVNGDQLHAAGSTLAVTGGTVTLNTDAGANGASASTNKLALAVTNTGAAVNLNVTQHVTQVTVSGGLVKLAPSSPTGSRVLDATGVSVTGGGQLDVTNNRLIVDYTGTSPITSIRQQLASGLNAGGARWAGAGITSSTAAADATLGLGFGEASELLGAGGGTFGSEAVDATSVVLRLTKNADATLDGLVNFDDLLALAKNYNSTTAYWNRGDFDYNGLVNFDDLLILAKHYNAVLPASAASIPDAPANFAADMAAAFAEVSVPEPSIFGLLGALATGALARRRRRA